MKEVIEQAANKAREIASIFERDGYQVFIEPTIEQVPIGLR